MKHACGYLGPVAKAPKGAKHNKRKGGKQKPQDYRNGSD
jgi:hypothetical protein